MNANKIAFFDFCETLTDFQTADAYVDFVRAHIASVGMRRKEKLQKVLNKTKIIPIAEKLTKHKFSINKRLKLFQLKGLNFKDLDELAEGYYEEMIKPHFIEDTVNILIKRKLDGWDVVLVSGGYDIYLKYFAMEFGISQLISTKVKFNGSTCTGTFDGIDCLNENKVKLLNRNITKETLNDSEAYSDSFTDIPFLQWVNTGYVVSRDEHQRWTDKYKFKEIIWTRNK